MSRMWRSFRCSERSIMSYDFTKPIPEELLDETPFNCPKCNHEMCILDENFRDNVVDLMFGD